jgi:signal recognition particle receptor subunit beta
MGALGAVVMADTRRLADSFPSIDYFERAKMPFVVAVNCFDGAQRFQSDTVRAALDLDLDVPVVLCDARQRSSSRDVLVTLVEYAISQLSEADAVNAG